MKKCFFLEEQIYERLLEVYNSSLPSMRTEEMLNVRGRTSLKDYLSEERPKSASTTEIIVKIQDMK